jgi:hypothetical protein
MIFLKIPRHQCITMFKNHTMTTTQVQTLYCIRLAFGCAIMNRQSIHILVRRMKSRHQIQLKSSVVPTHHSCCV